MKQKTSIFLWKSEKHRILPTLQIKDTKYFIVLLFVFLFRNRDNISTFKIALCYYYADGGGGGGKDEAGGGDDAPGGGGGADEELDGGGGGGAVVLSVPPVVPYP